MKRAAALLSLLPVLACTPLSIGVPPEMAGSALRTSASVSLIGNTVELRPYSTAGYRTHGWTEQDAVRWFGRVTASGATVFSFTLVNAGRSVRLVSCTDDRESSSMKIGKVDLSTESHALSCRVEHTDGRGTVGTIGLDARGDGSAELGGDSFTIGPHDLTDQGKTFPGLGRAARVGGKAVAVWQYSYDKPVYLAGNVSADQQANAAAIVAVAHLYRKLLDDGQRK